MFADADDTNLTLSAKTFTELKLALTPELNNLSCWLKANKLILNVAKTELMIIGSRQRLSAQCDYPEIRIYDQVIKRVAHTKSLGLTIDAQLSWGKHVEEICKIIRDYYLRDSFMLFRHVVTQCACLPSLQSKNI